MTSLLDVAKALAVAEPTRPSQSFLRRAISTAYYAAFQALARVCADQFVGASTRARGEWAQVFRAIDHGPAKNACVQAAALGLSADALRFANILILLQQERQRADYDPLSRFSREETLALVKQAEEAIEALDAVPQGERRAFAVLVAFKKR